MAERDEGHDDLRATASQLLLRVYQVCLVRRALAELRKVQVNFARNLEREVEVPMRFGLAGEMHDVLFECQVEAAVAHTQEALRLLQQK